MENYQSLWDNCLAMIRERCGDKYRHLYEVWFSNVRFESYSQDTHKLLVQVPSEYVYEYLETYGSKEMQCVTKEIFGSGVVLQYRIIDPEPSFAAVAAYLQQHSAYDSRKNPCSIHVGDARRRLEEGFRHFLKEKPAQWLPGYDRVVEWLTDNKGRGLLVVGTPGMGKTLLCTKILPVILGNGGRPIVSIMATDLHDRLPELLKERIVIIDDLGKEPRKFYGNIDNSFFELCDNAERTGQLLIITTNLSTTVMSPNHPSAHYYLDSIEHRYGTEVLDRLKAVTSMARIEGPSLR